MKFLAAAFVAACALGAAVPVLAQSTPAASPAPAAASASPSPSPSPSPTPRAWAASGSADLSYSMVANAKTFQFANGVNSRVFDTVDRMPMLNNLNLQLLHTGTIGGKLELSLGSDADVIASWPTANFNSIDITNAYLSAASGPLTLIVGKFSTLAGAEVIEAPGNGNFSRSILFGYAIPFTHTGARLTWAASSALSLIAGVNNGWDNTKGNGTGKKTLELGAAYTDKNLTLTAQGYSGTEQTAYFYNAPPNWSGVTGKRNVFDTVATYKAGPVLTFSANYDTGSQQNASLVDGTGTGTTTGTATWNGLAGYLTAALTPKVSAIGRYESFRDQGGYRTGYTQRWNEGTLTLAYAPTSSLLFRLEGRADRSNQNVWVDGSGRPLAKLSSLGFESVVKF